MRLDGPANHLRYLILGLQAEGERQLSAALQAAGTEVTPTQSEVLEVLVGHGSMSQGDLGDRLVCTKGNISRLIDRMEAKALVRREPDPEDRRRFEVVLTERGAGEFEKAKVAITSILEVLDALYDEKEMNVLVELLGRAADAMGSTNVSHRSAGEKESADGVST